MSQNSFTAPLTFHHSNVHTGKELCPWRKFSTLSMYTAYSICQFYRSVACGNSYHIFLREALAPPIVAVGGGPFATTFSGIVRGMSRKIRGASIVVLWRLTITWHGIFGIFGIFGSVDCWSEPSFPPSKASWRNPSLISESKICIHVHESLCIVYVVTVIWMLDTLCKATIQSKQEERSLWGLYPALRV